MAPRSTIGINVLKVKAPRYQEMLNVVLDTSVRVLWLATKYLLPSANPFRASPPTRSENAQKQIKLGTANSASRTLIWPKLLPTVAIMRRLPLPRPEQEVRSRPSLRCFLLFSVNFLASCSRPQRRRLHSGEGSLCELHPGRTPSSWRGGRDNPSLYPARSRGPFPRPSPAK